MDPLNGTITLIGDVIKGKARARRRHPRLHALLEEVEGILENYLRPGNDGPGLESDNVGDVTQTIKTEPESDHQPSETTAGDLELNPGREVKQELASLPIFESQSELDPGTRSNAESELESPVQEPWGSAEGKVFGIDWILEMILENADDDPVTLFKCRYVNKQWNKISTGILNARQTTEIRIIYEKNGFKIKRGKHPLPLECDSVTEDFDSAHHSGGHFPWNYFSIRGSLTNPQLQSFLSKYGKIIKQLSMQLSHRDEEIPFPVPLITEFKRLLVEQVPCIEVLTLCDFPSKWEELRLFPEPKAELIDVLKNLKKIHFASKPPQRLATDLLKVSRRLQKVDWKSDRYASNTWNIILNSNRVELLTRLHMYFTVSLINSNVLWKLIERQPLLSYIEIDPYFWKGEQDSTQDGFSIVSKFLESSSSTLTTLVIPQFILREISPIPRLPKLKRLVLSKASSKSFPVDENFSAAKYFPQMTHFAILFEHNPKDNRYMLVFPGHLTQDSLQSVKTLELHLISQDYNPMLPSIKLHQKFRKLKHLALRNILDFANNAKNLWTLERLQTLEINFDLGYYGKNEYPAIDAGFTGFSKETCSRLYEDSNEVEISTLNELRESKSLLDMKCLKTLTVVITGVNEWKQKRIISHLSGLFAFRMCPQLKVNLQVYVDSEYMEKIKHVLSPIFPFVQSTTFKERDLMSRFLNIR